jgi:hypothetical protein
MENLRIAAFGGFRSIPPRAGGAGADKFAVELYPRIVKKRLPGGGLLQDLPRR